MGIWFGFLAFPDPRREKEWACRELEGQMSVSGPQQSVKKKIYLVSELFTKSFIHLVLLSTC